MTTQSTTPGAFMTGNRRHRRIAYRATFTLPFKHEDTDLIEGVYRDREGDPLGRAILEQRRHEAPLAFLVLPEEEIPLVHVEATLDADPRIGEYDQVFALLYGADEEPLAGVRDTGERWDDGELVVYAFETDEEALEAQG
jgi:hypothetical protein